MSKTAVIVIVFSSILLVCIIGVGIIIGLGYANEGGDGVFRWSNLFGEGTEVAETESLDLSGISELYIDCVSGDIDVIKSDNAKVTLTGHIWPAEEASDFLKVFKEGDTLTVKFDLKSKPFGIRTDVHMSVYLPKENELDVKIKSSSGSIAVSDMQFGDLAINSTSGNTKVTDCRGNDMDLRKSSGNTNVENADFNTIDINSTSGNIDVVNTPANITLDSTSGSTDISGATGSIHLRSTSGRVSVSVDGTQLKPIDIDSTSGSVKLYLDNGANFMLYAKAVSGRISSDFEITVKGTSSSKSISGKSGDGGNEVNLRTTSGNIDIIEK